MSEDNEGELDDDVELDDVSSGKVADNPALLKQVFPEHLLKNFEIYSYRSAAAVLANSFPKQFSEIKEALEAFTISSSMIRMPGGNKGPIASYVDGLFSEEWVEARISADLHVKLLHAKKADNVLRQYTREGYLDGHRIDFLSDKVALDLEWNSKDQTYDRDLYAFSAFHNAGAVDVGVILTRGTTLDATFFRSLGKVLKKDGTDGEEETYKKFGASTTWMGKLLYRLDAGRNGGCPVLAIGITPNCVVP